jgi:hypothetical protein
VPAQIGESVVGSYVWEGEKWYPGCYNGDDELHVLKIGLVVDVAAVSKHGTQLNDLIESTIAKASFIYENQMNIKLEISELRIYKSDASAPSYATSRCTGVIEQLEKLQVANQLPSAAAVHVLTGCGNGYGTVGIAFQNGVCNTKDKHGNLLNKAVNQLHNAMSWTTFAHELGHNLGAEHSFEDGQGRTGGLMDYGNGKLDGEYQFNTKYRKNEMCTTMNFWVNGCGGYFEPAPPGTIRTDLGHDDFGGLVSGSSSSKPVLLVVTCFLFLVPYFKVGQD